MTWGDIAVLAVLVLVAAIVIWVLVKDRKKGCSCGCSNCAHREFCHRPEQKKQKRS